jgi:hypothetical protein
MSLLTKKIAVGFCVLTTVGLVSGCGQNGLVTTPNANEPEPLVFSSSTTVSSLSTTTFRVGSDAFSVEAVLADGGSAKNFVIKKNGVVWKTIDASFGETSIHIFKQTKNYIYLAPEIEGLGGYMLYEALPTRVVRVDVKTGDQKVFRVGGVLQDISDDEKNMLWVVAGQGSLSFVVYDTVSDKKSMSVTVDKKFAQAGNAHFSPDTKKFAYAAALGIPDRDGGAVVSVDIAKKQQTVLAEDLHSNKVPHIYGWKSAVTIDYRFE